MTFNPPAITADMIAANTITSTQIAAGTLTAAQIAAGTMTKSFRAARNPGWGDPESWSWPEGRADFEWDMGESRAETKPTYPLYPT